MKKRFSTIDPTFPIKVIDFGDYVKFIESSNQQTTLFFDTLFEPFLKKYHESVVQLSLDELKELQEERKKLITIVQKIAPSITFEKPLPKADSIENQQSEDELSEQSEYSLSEEDQKEGTKL